VKIILTWILEKQKVRELIWIHLAQARVQWWIFVRMAMNLQVLYREFLHMV
jgi:hypothetical protein